MEQPKSHAQQDMVSSLCRDTSKTHNNWYQESHMQLPMELQKNTRKHGHDHSACKHMMIGSNRYRNSM